VTPSGSKKTLDSEEPFFVSSILGGQLFLANVGRADFVEALIEFFLVAEVLQRLPPIAPTMAAMPASPEKSAGWLSTY